MTIKTKSIVGTMAYLTGVKKPVWEKMYPGDFPKLYDELNSNNDARTIRYLCKLRTALMLNYLKTDEKIKFEFRNIDTIDWFDSENIKWLQENGINIILTNKRVRDYYVHINSLIAANISRCNDLFPDWVDWECIKNLFVFPKYHKEDASKVEYEKYRNFLNDYPFQVYIYWQPLDCGYLFDTDEKIFKILYQMNDKKFEDKGKTTDASEETKENIYDFINNSTKIDIVVDCENSNVYKLYGMLKGLNSEELSKIHKIILFDDVNTNNVWSYLEKHIEIPVEHITVERVVKHKSLVDVRLTSGICKEFYKYDVTSFILLSSDSDYWALIQSIPEINFLLVVETEKCGQAIKDALKLEGIYYCYLDDFSTANIDELKRSVLLGKLKEYIQDGIIGKNGKELTKEIFLYSGINADASEINNFYEKYVKTLYLCIDVSGNFSISIKT